MSLDLGLFTPTATPGDYYNDFIKVIAEGARPVTVRYIGAGSYSAYELAIEFDDMMEPQILRDTVVSRLWSEQAQFQVSCIVSKVTSVFVVIPLTLLNVSDRSKPNTGPSTERFLRSSISRHFIHIIIIHITSTSLIYICISMHGTIFLVKPSLVLSIRVLEAEI